MCVFKCEEIGFFPTFMVVAFSTGDDRMWRIQGTPVFVRQTLVNSAETNQKHQGMVMNPPFFCGLNVSIVGFYFHMTSNCEVEPGYVKHIFIKISQPRRHKKTSRYHEKVMSLLPI